MESCTHLHLQIHMFYLIGFRKTQQEKDCKALPDEVKIINNTHIYEQTRLKI